MKNTYGEDITPIPPLPAPTGSEPRANEYEFTRCGGAILLQVPTFPWGGGNPNSTTLHCISESTATRLRDELNALIPNEKGQR